MYQTHSKLHNVMIDNKLTIERSHCRGFISMYPVLTFLHGSNIRKKTAKSFLILLNCNLCMYTYDVLRANKFITEKFLLCLFFHASAFEPDASPIET